MPTINYAKNYWVANNKPNLVFYSGAPGWVALTNAAYVAWLATGNLPAKILCDGELADVLLKAGLPNSVVAACGATSLGNLTPDDMLAVKLACGITVTSTATPALNGTYDVDPAAQADIAAEAQYISTFQAYSGGQAQLAWSDVSGAAHLFPADIATTKTFLVFARSAADYRTLCSLASAQVAAAQTPTWPNASIALP